MRWNCNGTIAPCVIPSRATVSSSARGSNARITTTVPPARSVQRKPAQLMFEYRPSEQSVRAPQW